jgi:putative DNA primase/helicase
MLLEQRWGRTSSGPSPDIMSLKALRIAFASETDEGRRFSTSRAKWLSSGDTLTGRNPHDKHATVFDPTHLLCLLTNNLPHAPGEDFAFWQRIHLIPFSVRFVDKPSASNERPCDKELPYKLKAEAPGILAWLVRGCLEWQRQGLNPPLVVRSATEQYRFNEDLIAEFLNDCCYPKDKTRENAREKFKDLYKAFENWYLDTIGDTKYMPQKKKFNALMEKKFTRNKTGGQIWFHGVLLKAEHTTDWV